MFLYFCVLYIVFVFFDFLLFLNFLVFSVVFGFLRSLYCFCIFRFSVVFGFSRIFSIYMYLQDDWHAPRPVAPVNANNTTRIGHTSDEDIASDQHRQSAQGTVYKTVNAAYVQLMNSLRLMQRN